MQRSTRGTCGNPAAALAPSADQARARARLRSIGTPLRSAVVLLAAFMIATVTYAPAARSEHLGAAAWHSWDSGQTRAELKDYAARLGLDDAAEALAPVEAARQVADMSWSAQSAQSQLLEYAESIGEPADAETVVVAQNSAYPDGAIPASYVGSDTCLGCHEASTHTFEKTLMGRIFLENPRNAQEQLGCEACHGPGSAHVEAGGGPDLGGPNDIIAFGIDSPRPAREQNDVCLNCHERSARTHWQGSTHESRGLTCTNCHSVMEEVSPKFNLAKATVIDTCSQCHKDRRAQLYRSSHMPMREGKIDCSDCHNPHGSPNPKLLTEATTNDTCYRCHAERRGPFLWDHPPVREDCGNCHEPHGSMHDKLLTMPLPNLCQRCHSESRHPATPRDPGNRTFVFNRGCVNCHGGVIHGSNHPAGVRFHR